METPAMTEMATEHRFVALQGMRDPPGVREHNGMEHRWGLRIPCCATVRLSAGSAMTGSGRMRNVSMSGAYVETSLALPLFAPLEIAVLPSDDQRGTPLFACVVRRDATGIGIEWADTAPGGVCPLLDCTQPCAAGRRRR